MTNVMHESPECMDRDQEEGCDGDVEFRMALSATGTAFPRCDRHWDLRLTAHQAHQERYPDSDCPPSWFDPLNAGESWDDD